MYGNVVTGCQCLGTVFPYGVFLAAAAYKRLELLNGARQEGVSISLPVGLVHSSDPCPVYLQPSDTSLQLPF